MIAAHQVDHLPWLGYFSRMLRVDCFVDLDEVQYNHHRFQNRNRIVDPAGRVLWLRVPIRGGKRCTQRMSEAEIADEPWQRSYLETIRHAYCRRPYFRTLFGELREVLERPWRRLVDLNRALRSLLARHLEVEEPSISQSELGLGELHGEELLIALAERLGAGRFLSGPTGASFLSLAAFEAAGLPLCFDAAFEARPYPQHALRQFVPDLSALDLVMNLGSEAAGWLRDAHGRP